MRFRFLVFALAPSIVLSISCSGGDIPSNVGAIPTGDYINTGDYIKGEIPPGEYALIRVKDKNGRMTSGYFAETVGGEIIDNENFGSFGYVYCHGLGDVKTGGILIPLNALKAGARSFYEEVHGKSSYIGGFYKIGVDLPPGSYHLESVGGNGYYAISSGPIGRGKILDNGSFDGKRSVIVRSGQYLLVHRSRIIYP